MSILDKDIRYVRTSNGISMKEKIFDELVYRIHQLEKENVRLKDSRDWWKDRFFGQQEYDDSHRIAAIEYKKRIDEASEILHNLNDTLPLDLILSEIEHSENILQNGS